MNTNSKGYNQRKIIESYSQTFLQHGDAPEAVQWSEDGQRWRFEKLIEIMVCASGQSLNGHRILEIGCGLGHFYPMLCSVFAEVDYTGIDIVPEMIAHAKSVYLGANFECRDIFNFPIQQEYGFVFISGVFNAPFFSDSKEIMAAMLAQAYAASRIGMAFNFTSSHVNFVSEGANYFDPGWVLNEVLSKLSKKVVMHHHYRNCAVAVGVYR